MNQPENDLNELLLRLYRLLEKLEGQILKSSKDVQLTIGEVHFLEAVATFDKDTGATVSALAAVLGIRMPSVTAAVNKLAQKGYVVKEKCPGDARVVRVKLTRSGHRAERAHRYFHRRMVREAMQGFSDEEQRVLLGGVARLDAFLERKLAEYEEKA